jgi:N-acyl-L-homoserine lactone synthetase
MLRYLYADQLKNHPRLADEMFTHRADQFRTRLGWDVNVDTRGHERDEYDALNPLYVIWECTRFCMAPGQGAHVAAALMLGGGELMNGFGVRHFVGVFDARMVRIYKRVGSSPEVLGSTGEGREQISVGLWAFEADAQMRVAERAGISPALSQSWFNRAFGTEPVAVFAQTG